MAEDTSQLTVKHLCKKHSHSFPNSHAAQKKVAAGIKRLVLFVRFVSAVLFFYH